MFRWPSDPPSLLHNHYPVIKTNSKHRYCFCYRHHHRRLLSPPPPLLHSHQQHLFTALATNPPKPPLPPFPSWCCRSPQSPPFLRRSCRHQRSDLRHHQILTLSLEAASHRLPPPPHRITLPQSEDDVRVGSDEDEQRRDIVDADGEDGRISEAKRAFASFRRRRQFPQLSGDFQSSSAFDVFVFPVMTDVEQNRGKEEAANEGADLR